MLEYYNRMHEKSHGKIQDLSVDLVQMQGRKDKMKEYMEGEIEELKEQLNLKIEHIKDENVNIRNQVNGMSEYSDKREDLMLKFEELEKMLEIVKESHSAELYVLEKEQVQDKDRLKKEMQAKVNAVASEFRRVSNQQMAETTKRTITINVAVNAKLVKLTDRVKDLMHENENLRLTLQDQNRKLEIIEKTDKSLQRKNNCTARLIELLAEKSNEIETDLVVMEDVLEETVDRLHSFRADEETRMDMKMKFGHLDGRFHTLKARNFSLKNSNSATEKKLTSLLELIDRCSVDISHQLAGDVGNVVPNLLNGLAKGSSIMVRKKVENRLIESSVGVVSGYRNGSVGLVPKES